MASDTDDQLKRDTWTIQDVIDTLYGVAVITSLDGRVVTVNKGPSTSRVLDRELVIGRCAWEHPWFAVTDEDRDKLKRAIEDAASGKEVRYDAAFKHRNGKWGVVDLSVAPLRDAAGEITHVIGFGVDVTPRIHAEKELKDQRDFAQNLVETAPTIVKVIDNEGRIQHANPFLLEKTGYALEEILGKSWFEVFLPEQDRAQVQRVLKETKPGHDTSGIVNRITTRDGREILVEWRNRALLNGDGEAIGTLSIGQDITEQHRIRTELESREAMLVESQRLAKMGSWHLDLVDGKLHWSAEVYRIFEIDDEQFGASYEAFLNAIHPDDRERVDAAYRRSVETKIPYSVEHRLIFPDGRIKYVVERCETYYDDDGTPMRSIGTVQDITERYLMEEELRDSKLRAEEASRAKSEFLSHMSHELRTPLNAIIGFAQVMRLDNEVSLSEKAANHVDEISRAGAHLLALVDEILELSRIESGSLNIELAPLNVMDVLEEALALMRPLADEQDISLNVAGCSADGRWVFADRIRLKQILINLISNAIKYSARGGEVRVHTEDADGDMLRVIVADQGQGIAMARQSELFEPFNRLGAERTGIEGAGIGLTITRRLVEMMDGRIGFESEEGVGSLFWVDLVQPEPTEHEKQPEGRPSPIRPAADCRILYVEDNSTNVRLMDAILESLPGTQLVTAATGEMGVELAKKMVPDIILMDIGLPGIDGFEAQRQLRQDEKTRDIPVIAISAHILPKDVSAALEVGFQDYLTKPIDVANFLKVLSRYTGQPDAA